MDIRGKQLVDDAFQVNIQEFMRLTEHVTQILKSEETYTGNLATRGKLIVSEPEGEAIIIGDLHGDLQTLAEILIDSRFMDKMQTKKKQPLLLFLGDYGDRGVNSPEVFYVVLKLKETYPANVALLRGNHEGPGDLLPSPHDLPIQLQRKFGAEWSSAYRKLRGLFSELYLAMLVKQRFILLHGGVPSGAKSIEDIAFAHRRHPAESHLEEILWSDPEENMTGTIESPRGAGKLFGIDVTEKFLRMLNVRILIRGHEPAENGYEIDHDGRILTLFSRKGEPYYNGKAAYLMLDLSRDFMTAYELANSIRTLQ